MTDILLFALGLIILIAVLVGALRWMHILNVNDCRRLSENIGYNVRYYGSECHIEILPGVWAPASGLAEYLPLIDCR